MAERAFDAPTVSRVSCPHGSWALRRKGLCIMTSMKRRTAIAVTVGVWVAGLGSAAALTYDLNRPMHLAGARSPLAKPINAEQAAVAEPVLELQPVLYIPTITVVGQLPHGPGVTREPKPAVDISLMHCADWRELDMGSGRVQICE